MNIPDIYFDYVRDYLESYARKSLKERRPCFPDMPEDVDPDHIDRIMDGVFERIEESRLIEEHGYWGVHPDFPREDWVYSVQNDDTRTGYWQWVAKQIVEEGD